MYFSPQGLSKEFTDVIFVKVDVDDNDVSLTNQIDPVPALQNSYRLGLTLYPPVTSSSSISTYEFMWGV